MILHSDFRDYYDYAVGYGVDEKVHYNRFTREVVIRVRTGFDYPKDRRAGVLGFCGKIYPYVELRKYNRNFHDECPDEEELKVVETFYAFDHDEFQKKEAELGDYTRDRSYVDHSRKVRLRQFFADWAFESDELFRELAAPVWTTQLDAYEHRGLINPRLADFGFERFKDAFAAFQDISVYLANILVEQKETARIEDRYRIEQHGFDRKKSFRKEKK